MLDGRVVDRRVVDDVEPREKKLELLEDGGVFDINLEVVSDVEETELLNKVESVDEIGSVL